ncbi:MAG: Rne/Rng family ribonuclease [Zoogloeaceae bacterium]|nr:Rne/Rng family ribonuclease [Zoogloeaceae bacterium]
MKRMLFNATQAEELRVAIVDGQKLIDLDIESASKEQRKSNIYKGVITRIEPSLEAVFVNYGEDRHGFLPFKEISRSYFQPGANGHASIKSALKEGQELIVQVDKDERGSKGAALTTFVSLAGRYLVLMPNNPRGGGVSRRVDGEDRAELREIMDALEVPQGMSLIARTAAISRQQEELQWDLNYLLQLWYAIEGIAKEKKAPLLIYKEGSLVIRAIRDCFQPEIGEILIDTDEIFEQAQAFMQQVMPGNANRVKRYHDDVPLFSRFQIEHQIETAFGRQVNLPSGGAIVLDHTEALVAVDVNSGRATRGADIEETAFKTNLEAAEEVARQLRLRDLGGLIVIDFIDMESAKNQREVEQRLKEALKFDRARVQTGKISRFGLMELSRQRLRPALAEMSYISCPRCTGTGHIRSTESAALHLLRILEEEAMKDNTATVHAQAPVDVSTFLLNEKRHEIQGIELRHKVSILLIPNVHLETPAHLIQRLNHENLNTDDVREQPSYTLMEHPGDDISRLSGKMEEKKPRQEAVIKSIAREQPAPVMAEKKTAETQSLISRLLSWFRTPASTENPPPAPAKNKRRGNTGERRVPPERNRRDNENEGRKQQDGKRREPRDALESSVEKPRDTKEVRERKNRNEPRNPEQGERNGKGQNREREVKADLKAEEKKPRTPDTPTPPPEIPKAKPRQPETAEANLNSAPVTQETQGEEASGSRRGNRGRNRGRNRNRDQAETINDDAPETPSGEYATATVEVEAAPPAVAASSVENFTLEPSPAATVDTANQVMNHITSVLETAKPERPPAPEAEARTAAATPMLNATVEENQTSPAREAPVQATEPQTASVAEAQAAVPPPQAAEPQPTAVVIAPQVPPPQTAPVSFTHLEAELETSGLVLVQTSSPAEAAPEAAVPAAARRGRPRRRPEVTETQAEEPLTMVETSKQ